MANDDDKTRTADSAPQSAEEYSKRGWTNLTNHKDTEAISDFNEALTLNANLVDAAYGLGKALQANNQLAEAEKAFNKAITLLDDGIYEDKIRADMLRSLIERSRKYGLARADRKTNKDDQPKDQVSAETESAESQA